MHVAGVIHLRVGLLLRVVTSHLCVQFRDQRSKVTFSTTPTVKGWLTTICCDVTFVCTVQRSAVRGHIFNLTVKGWLTTICCNVIFVCTVQRPAVRVHNFPTTLSRAGLQLSVNVVTSHLCAQFRDQRSEVTTFPTTLTVKGWPTTVCCDYTFLCS